MSVNRRQYPRVPIHMPVTYALFENEQKSGPDYIGIALDVSLGGLLLESFDFVATEYVGISFIDIGNQIAQMVCKMVYSRKPDVGADNGPVQTGLSFQGTEAEKADFAAKIIRAYFYRKKRMLDSGTAATSSVESAGQLLDLA